MKKILVIEDELLLRQGIAEILNFEGFNVIEAPNGEKGILAALHEAPDLVLCDIMMPLMDGYEVLYQIRCHDSTKLIPFIFMTALAERSDQRSGMELGSDDYITKPFTREELLSAVNTQLRKSNDKTEQAESRLNELRNTIIRHLPHELLTPLNGMMVYGELLKDYPETMTLADLPEIGKNIYNSALRLNHLIQNYLIYSQLELRSPIIRQENPLKDVKQKCDQVAIEVASRYERLNNLLLETTDGPLYMGETEFIKIVEEMTDNAFKFSPQGSLVTVRCGIKMGKFYLQVEDFGRGMSAANISRIGAYMQFKREQLEQQGSGLGLIITKRLIEMHRGELLIESTEGIGSKLTATFPVI
jgi:signal transduction histidine kinase